MRNKLSLPIQQNAIIALFLLKKLQPYFAPQAKTLNEIGTAISQLSTPKNYDLFEDFDEKLEAKSQILGEQSALAINETMLSDMIIALVERKKLNIVYQSDYEHNPVERTICPVKLVMSKGELYFMCISEYSEKRNYWIKLCRIIKAELTNEVFTVSLKRWQIIENRLKKSTGILSDDVPKSYTVEILFPSFFEQIFSEKKFHYSQKIKKDKQENVLLSMHVPVDRDLIQWILGWSDRAVVLKPKKLRDELYNMGKFLVKKYKRQDSKKTKMSGT
jgi:predicted DNA-binding transcriptional regulator YafY